MVLSLSVATAVVGCGPKKGPVAASGPDAPRFGGPWSSKIDAQHPLVGRIFDAKASEFVDQNAVVERVRKAHFVLLGEKHDNPDHHRLQAAMIKALSEGARKPTVAMEMVDMDEQEALDSALASTPKDPDAIARGVAWHHKGWPAWAMYRPIGEVVAQSGLPVIGANYPSHAIKALFSPTPPALDHPTAARFAVEQPLLPALQKSLEDELRASHCGMLPEASLPKMVLAQRLRDGAMADRMVETERPDGAVLIAGDGHVRLDRGVPMVLRLKGAGSSVVSIAFLEVASGVVEPPAYASTFHVDTLPFDFVWFTPRVDDSDPCAEFKKKS
jgi:uncharacterized iron-regulated protein